MAWLDVASVFWQAYVIVDHLVDYDSGAEYLEVQSNGLPNHGYDERMAARHVQHTIGLSPPPIKADSPIGVAANGVEIYPYLDATGVDLVRRNRTADGCFGFTVGDKYVYRTAPPCMYREDVYTSLEASLRLGYGDGVGGVSDRALRRRTQTRVVGVMFDGRVLHGPLDGNGQPHVGLDECNGKYNDDGVYAYYATLEAPYTIGCWGPRDGALIDAQSGVATSCPAGSYCTDGVRNHCPAGTYGAGRGLRTEACSGLCPEGFFCPLGTVEPMPCGEEAYYCPLGSAQRQLAPVFSFTTPRDDVLKPFQSGERSCEPGSFCSSGATTLCPAGVFGEGVDANCSGVCPAGFVCPEGSPAPVALVAGRYSSRTGLDDHSKADICPPGSFCVEASTEPVLCPAGRACPRSGAAHWGPTFGGRLCPPGYACPEGTANETAVPCGSRSALELLLRAENPEDSSWELSAYATGLRDAVYCPMGSAIPTRAEAGFYTIGGESNEVRSSQHRCEPGHYCAAGVRHPCPAGSFGAIAGLATSACSGQCAPGYYCLEASASARHAACGDASVFCPLGSQVPLSVGAGNYSAPFTDYYNTLTDSPPVVGAASAAASTSFFDVRAEQRVCEPGYYCADGLRRPCPAGTYGSSRGLTTPACDGECPPGMYCVEGSTEAIPTPGGVYCRGGCRSARGDGACESGYYCPSGSSSPLQRPCCDARRDDTTGLWFRYGSDSDSVDLVSLVSRDGEAPPGLVRDHDGWHQHDRYAPRCETLYCPRASAEPHNVTLGYYASGGNRTTRSSQARCLAAPDDDAQQPMLLGDVRASYCPSTTRVDVAGAPTLAFSGSEISLAATPEGGAAWDTPLYLGLGHYEWNDDANVDDDLLLYKHQRRFAQVASTPKVRRR